MSVTDDNDELPGTVGPYQHEDGVAAQLKHRRPAVRPAVHPAPRHSVGKWPDATSSDKELRIPPAEASKNGQIKLNHGDRAYFC